MTRATLPGSFRNSTRQGIRVDTHRAFVVDLEDTEASGTIPLRSEFPAPKRESLTPLQRAIATALGAFIAWAVLVGLGSVVAN